MSVVFQPVMDFVKVHSTVIHITIEVVLSVVVLFLFFKLLRRTASHSRRIDDLFVKVGDLARTSKPVKPKAKKVSFSDELFETYETYQPQPPPPTPRHSVTPGVFFYGHSPNLATSVTPEKVGDQLAHVESEDELEKIESEYGRFSMAYDKAASVGQEDEQMDDIIEDELRGIGIQLEN